MKKLTKKQAQLLARRLKYRAPCYYDLWFDCIASSASIRNEGNQVVVEISAYDSDTKNVLEWARDNIPHVRTRRHKALNHWYRTIYATIPHK